MMRTLGDYIESYLQRTGMSQTDLAAKAGIPRLTVNRLVNKKTALPNADTRRKLAAAMGVTHLDLLIETGELEPEEALGAGATLTASDALPASIRDLLEGIDWTDPEAVSFVAPTLKMLRGYQQRVPPPLHDPNEVERRPRKETGDE